MKLTKRSLQLFAALGATLAYTRNPEGSDHSYKPTFFPLTGADPSDNVGFRSTGPRSNLSSVETPKMFRFVRLLYVFFLAGFLVLPASVAQYQAPSPSVATWQGLT
jgi:hypothetical protein